LSPNKKSSKSTTPKNLIASNTTENSIPAVAKTAIQVDAKKK